jgi:hypothetical protein
VSAAVALAVAVLCVAGAGWQVPAGPSRATSTRGDALTGAARRAARAWHRHDFAALVAGSPGVIVRRRGADPSAPMPPAQAARTLRAFAGGAEEVQTEVGAVREVDEDRGYTEVQRTYVVTGTSARRVQTLYLVCHAWVVCLGWWRCASCREGSGRPPGWPGLGIPRIPSLALASTRCRPYD